MGFKRVTVLPNTNIVYNLEKCFSFTPFLNIVLSNIVFYLYFFNGILKKKLFGFIQ